MQNAASIPDGEALSGIAIRLARVRGDSGLNQRQFAERLGIPKRTYLSWERGEAEPSIGLLRAVRREFGIDLAWLLDGPGDDPIHQAAALDKQRLFRLLAIVRRDLADLDMEPDMERVLRLTLAVFDRPPEAEAAALKHMRVTLEALVAGSA